VSIGVKKDFTAGFFFFGVSAHPSSSRGTLLYVEKKSVALPPAGGIIEGLFANNVIVA
jgi:hypothetical protein